MKIDRMEYERRMNEFRGPIQIVAFQNPIVHRIVEMYAHGEIITKEEALSKMIVLLAENNKGLEDYTRSNER
jgi:hypothetical protein